MNCRNCSGAGTMERQLTRFCVGDADEPFFVENVPAFVCRLCGEKLFPGGQGFDTLLISIREGRLQPNAIRSIAVYDFQQPIALPKPEVPAYQEAAL